MDNSLIINVPEGTTVDGIAQRLVDLYNSKGFTATANCFNNSISISFEKDMGGINTITGLGVAIKANLTLNNGTLYVSYTEAEWTSKIVGAVIGWFLCWIPIVTAIIGAIKQNDLPKNISNDIRRIVG